MGFTLNDSDVKNTWAADDVICTIDVTAGDLIVVGTSIQVNSINISNISDDDGNSYTLRSQRERPGTGGNMRQAYAIAQNTTTIAITVDFDENTTTTRRIGIAASFTPDSGETVTFDVAMFGYGLFEVSPWETGQDDTTGDDELCWAYFYQGGSTTFSNEEIPGGAAADQVFLAVNGANCFYSILSATASNLYAETDPSAQGYYTAEMLCFKSEAPAGLELTGSRIANASRSWQAVEDADVSGWNKSNPVIIGAMIEKT